MHFVLNLYCTSLISSKHNAFNLIFAYKYVFLFRDECSNTLYGKLITQSHSSGLNCRSARRSFHWNERLTFSSLALFIKLIRSEKICAKDILWKHVNGCASWGETAAQWDMSSSMEISSEYWLIIQPYWYWNKFMKQQIAPYFRNTTQ